MSQDVRQVIDQINKAFAEGRIEGFLEHCAEDVVWVMEGESTFKGVPAVREFMSSAGGAPPPEFTIEKVIVDGDSVVCYGEMSMSEPEGCEGRYSYCDAYTFAGGKVKELRSFVVKHRSEDEKNEAAAG